jgi:hypothetical protein
MPVLQHLKSDHGILGLFLDFPLDPALGGPPDNEQSGIREPSGHHGKRHHEFCAQSQINPHLPGFSRQRNTIWIRLAAFPRLYCSRMNHENRLEVPVF